MHLCSVVSKIVIILRARAANRGRATIKSALRSPVLSLGCGLGCDAIWSSLGLRFRAIKQLLWRQCIEVNGCKVAYLLQCCLHYSASSQLW